MTSFISLAIINQMAITNKSHLKLSALMPKLMTFGKTEALNPKAQKIAMMMAKITRPSSNLNFLIVLSFVERGLMVRVSGC